MSKDINRRKFLKSSLVTSAGVVSALSLEEKTLLAAVCKEKPKAVASRERVTGLQTGKIGNLTISRLIVGGNLISGYAHSRNLIYVSSLLRHYFTDEKVIETLQICEENGINTAVLRCDDHVIGLLKKYRKERGGKIQWIAQIKPKELDLTSAAKKAIDNGAVAVFIHGGVGDSFFNNGKIELLGKVVSFIKENNVIAGIGGHLLDVPMAVEEAGIEPDFYFKTLNTVDYVCEEPEKVIRFMGKVKKPWIAFKVLGAGAVHPGETRRKVPQEGFKYAFESGADFIAVGMYDFQIKENVAIAKEAAAAANRKRPWIV